MPADSKSDSKQILQSTLDEVNQAVKVNIVATSGGAGGATEATALDILTAVDSIDTKTPALVSGRQPVDGSGVTQPISAVSLPLPTGAATETTLAGIRTRQDIINFGSPATAQRVAAELGQGGSAVSGANPLFTTVQSGNVTSDLATIDTNSVQTAYGTPGTGSLRVAAMLGLGTAVVSTTNPVPTDARTIVGTNYETNFGTPSTGSQRVTAMLGLGAAAVSAGNPIPISAASLPLPTGAASETTLSALNTKVANNYGAASGAVRTASQLGNASGIADFGTGVSSAQTLRVALANESKPTTGVAAVQLTSSSIFPYFQDFSSVNLSTTYTQVIASTGTQINRLNACNNSGTAIYISTGAAASEIVQYIILPGEAISIPLQIASGSRIAIRTQTGTLSTGQFNINAFAG